MENKKFEVEGIITKSSYPFYSTDTTKKEKIKTEMEFLELEFGENDNKYIITDLLLNNDFLNGDTVELAIQIQSYNYETNETSIESYKTLMGELNIRCDNYSDALIEYFIVDDFNVLLYLASFENCILSLQIKHIQQ